VLPADTVKAALHLPSTWFNLARLGAGTKQAPGGVSGSEPQSPPARFVVVLASVPAGEAKPKAPALAHVGRSDDLGTALRPGYWVTYLGPYTTWGEAARAAAWHAGSLVRARF
jgi:hypothetical protein